MYPTGVYKYGVGREEYKWKNQRQSRMSYFVFDLDKTLAELYSAYYFIASLRLRETVRDTGSKSRSIPPVPAWLQTELTRAYECFVRRVLEEETSDKPLGILRPGILDIMTDIHQLQHEGIIQEVIIYSNSGHLESLHFVRDLIHEHLGRTDLIKDCIHWHHPMRDEERSLIAGFPNKTWNVLRRIMTSPPCHAPSSLSPKNVHFFDDLEHWDLKRTLQENYHQVPPYEFKASFERLADLFRDSVQEANISHEAIAELQDYVIQLFAMEDDTVFISRNHELESILHLFGEKIQATASPDREPPFWDRGVQQMRDVLVQLYEGIGSRRHKRTEGGVDRKGIKRQYEQTGTWRSRERSRERSHKRSRKRSSKRSEKRVGSRKRRGVCG